MTHCKWMFVTLIVLAGPAMAGGERETDGRAPVQPATEADPRLAELEAELARLEERLKQLDAGAKDPAGSLLEFARTVQVDGFVDALYGRNLTNPDGRRGVNEGRLVDPDHDTVGIPYAALGLRREVSGRNELDAGFRLQVAFGRLVEEALADDGLFDDGPLDLPEAYVDLQLPTPWRPLLVRAGRQVSFLGGEGIDLSRNAFVSLSPLATFGPKTLTGLSVGVDLGAGLRYTQWVGNGWDQVIDGNAYKTLGGQLAWRVPAARLDLTLAWLAGAERADSNDMRSVGQLDVAWSPLSALSLKASLQLGQEAGASLGGGTARWTAASLSAQQGLLRSADGGFHHLSFALRGSFFRDEGGARTGADQLLSELTASFEVRPVEAAALRLEYRHDRSNEAVFGGEREQDTLALELRYQF